MSGSSQEEFRPVVPLDQVLADIGLGYFHMRLLLVCGIGFSAAAIEVVLMSFLFPELRDGWDLNEYELGVIPTLVGFGSVLGELCWGLVADQYGRKPVFMVTVIIVVLFGMASALSPGYKMLYLMRFMVGFGYGGNIAVDFTMFSEFLPTQGRGNMLFLISAFWPVGQFMTCLFAWLVIPPLGWRYFLVVCALPSLVTAFFRPLIPESPRWLLLVGRVAEATEVCRHMAIVSGKDPAEVGLPPGKVVALENEVGALVNAPVKKDEDKSILDWAPFRCFSPGLWRTTLGTLIYTTSLGFAGYGCTTFMPSFFEMKGMSEMSVYLSMVVTSLAQFPGIIAAAFISNRVGRRGPLQGALLAIAVALCFFAAVKTQIWMVVCSCMASCCLEFGWALFHVYMPEVFPTEIRATACGVVSGAGSLVGVGCPLMVAWLLETYGKFHVILFFALICILGSACARLLLNKETLDRDLDDFTPNRLDGMKSPEDSVVTTLVPPHYRRGGAAE